MTTNHDERAAFTKAADALEAEYLAVAQGAKTPSRIALKPMVMAVQALRLAAGQPAAATAPRCRDLTDDDMDQLTAWLAEHESDGLGHQGLCEKIIVAFAVGAADAKPAAATGQEPGAVAVPQAAVEWLFKYKPVLCEKAGLRILDDAPLGGSQPLVYLGGSPGPDPVEFDEAPPAANPPFENCSRGALGERLTEEERFALEFLLTEVGADYPNCASVLRGLLDPRQPAA